VTDAKSRTVKTIAIDVDKCNGCRACEVICSAFHAKPRYSSVNPARARIRVIREPLSDIYVPVYAGEYTAAECAGRDKYTIDGKTYEECAFCRASCPSRELFKEPEILILDEATSSIDTRTERLIEKGMDALMENRTVFVIAHRLSTVRNSKAILVLEDGKVLERGDHEDLLAQKGRYYQLYTGQYELS